MTIWLQYDLTSKGRLSAGRSGEVMNDRPVHSVLPGTVIRGALGSVWWRDDIGSAGQEAFDDLFDGQLIVEAAVPRLDDGVAQLRPMGWARCKYPDGEHGGWRDNTEAKERNCECGQPLVAGKGWELPVGLTTMTTRTQLVNGVAAEGALFTRRANSSRVHYTGTLQLNEDIDPTQLRWLLTPKQLSIGGQKSIMGRCSWVCQEVPDPMPLPDDEGPFVLTTLQPTILLDECGANSTDLAGAVRGVVGRADGNIQLSPHVYTRTTIVSGWHGLAGVPKPTEWALEAGSSVLIKKADTRAVAALRAGIGIRRNEGYGAVALTKPGVQPGYGQTQPRAQPEAAATVVEEHPILELLRRFPEEDRPSVRNKLRDAATAINRRTGPARGMEANRWLRQPWAATLPADLHDSLRQTLIAIDSAGLIAALRGWQP